MPMLRELVRADAEAIAHFNRHGALRWGLVTIVGCGVYGTTVGIWRAPLQAGYTALKFPLLIFLTCGGNALLSGILAQLLGSGLSFRQTSAAILMSFATAAVILGALSPITLFVIFNAPALTSSTRVVGHSIVLLMHVFLIAYAGIVANRGLLRVLQQLTGSRAVARRVLVSWLAGNLLLGAQLAWVLRPFIGSPRLAVQFLRDDPLRGNFYEAVARALSHLLF
jgi:hypothetical protein